MMRARLLFVLFVTAAACGGAAATTASTGGDGGVDGGAGSPKDAGCDAEDPSCPPPPAPAPFACGTQTCGTTQYCLIPCCGGAPPRCYAALDDAGTCASGTHYEGSCPDPVGSGPCVEDPCTPPPAQCVNAASDYHGYCMPDDPDPTHPREIHCVCE